MKSTTHCTAIDSDGNIVSTTNTLHMGFGSKVTVPGTGMLLNDCMELITTQLHMLEHLSPVDYAVVRTALGHGAGFDSPGFRRVHRISPPLDEAFEALLARRGVALLDVYRRGYELEDLYQLAEQLLTWDERVILWRFHHLKVVERIIGGNVIGTQGTPVEVLGKRIDVRFFPELWAVRDEITRRSPLGADGHSNR